MEVYLDLILEKEKDLLELLQYIVAKINERKESTGISAEFALAGIREGKFRVKYGDKGGEKVG